MRDNTIPYVLTAGSETVTLDFNTETYVEVCEWNAAVRGRRTDRSLKHGSRIDPAKKAGGVWSADIRVRGEDTDLHTNQTDLATVLNELLNGDGTLSFTPQGSTRRLRIPSLTLESESWKISGSSWLVGVMLGSEKPFAEDADATTVESDELTVGGGGFTIPLTIPFTITPSSGGTLEVTHEGTFPEAYPVLQMVGPATDPILINQTTGKRIKFTGSIAAGDYWEVDLFDSTVRLNGGTRIRAIDVAESEWWACVRGVNELQMAASGYTSSTLLRAIMRSSWA